MVVRTADAESLHALFSDSLGLPVTWPLQRAGFATFGWIGLGNTNLEIWEATDNSDLPADCPFPLIHQIALEPHALTETLERLRVLGFNCKAPRAYASKDASGTVRTNFTNSVILDLSHDACCVFVCDWDRDAPIVPWAKGLSTPERRVLEREVLAASAGGPLGLVGLQEIALSVRDPAPAAKRWQRLAGSQAHPIALTEDVRVELSAGPRDLIQSLTFAVLDLYAARRFLVSRDLLDKDDIDDVVFSRRATGGLTFRLVEADAGRRRLAQSGQ